MTSSSPGLLGRFLVVGTVMLGGLQVAAPAHAQRSATDIESARQLYNQGVQLRDLGDLKGALEKLKAAHALGNTPITGLDLCKTHAALAQPVEAREVCLGVARIPPLAGETARSQDARNEAGRVAEEMKPKIANVRLHLTGVPPNREPTVLVDGSAVPAAALTEARAVNPGRHEISAKVGRGAESKTAFDLAPGESKSITLPVQVAPDDPGPDPAYPGRERPPPPQRANSLAVAGFIVGGVGVGVGAISGIVALASKPGLDKSCTNQICGTEDHAALDRARRWGDVSTVAFIVGGVGVLVGLYATLIAPKTTAQSLPDPRSRPVARMKTSMTPDFGPGGVGIHGAF